MKRIAVTAMAVFATLVAVFAIWQLRSIVLLFVVSLAVAAMMRPPIDALSQRRIPRALAVIFVVLTGLCVLAAGLFLIVPTIVAQLPLLAQEVGQAYSQTRQNLQAGGTFSQLVARALPTNEFIRQLLNGSGLTLDAMVSVTGVAFEAITQLIVVIILALYWTSYRVGFERLWLSLLLPTQRARARAAWQKIEDEVGAYLRSEAAQTLLTGVLLFIGLQVLGVKYAPVLAAIAALAWLVPIVGALVALPPVLVIAALSGPAAAAASGVLLLMVYVLMELVVEPRLYPRRRFGILWTVLFALALLDTLGLVGLLVAPIVSTIVQIVIEAWLKPASSTMPAPSPTATPISILESIDALQLRLAKARDELAQLESPPPHAVGLMSRLEATINKVSQEI